MGDRRGVGLNCLCEGGLWREWRPYHGPSLHFLHVACSGFPNSNGSVTLAQGVGTDRDCLDERGSSQGLGMRPWVFR